MTPAIFVESPLVIALKLAFAVGVVGTISSTIFLLMTLIAAIRYKKLADRAQTETLAVPRSLLPAVSILKPIHGMEEKLEDNLASFFQQDYPEFEVIFGARDAENAALKIVER